jgi:hypothetical protein
MFTTQKSLRNEFWFNHPQFKRRGKTKQNDYCADIRITCCDFIEHMRRNGEISDKLANKATL